MCFTRAVYKAPDSPDGEPVSLSPRQAEIIELLARGLQYKEIAARLSISLSTVKCHQKKIFLKLRARSSNEAVYNHRPRS